MPICGAEDAPPSLDSPELAQGRYAAAHMLLAKTIFGIRVADIDVRVLASFFAPQSDSRQPLLRALVSGR
jgi:hypothetical protein